MEVDHLTHERTTRDPNLAQLDSTNSIVIKATTICTMAANLDGNDKAKKLSERFTECQIIR